MDIKRLLFDVSRTEEWVVHKLGLHTWDSPTLDVMLKRTILKRIW